MPLSADDILTNPADALSLREQDVVLTAVLIVEYATLDPDAERPEQRRFAWAMSDDMTPWAASGLLHFVDDQQVSRLASIDADDS